MTNRKLNGDHCRCAACGEYFNSTAAFDKHRIGDMTMRSCRTPDVMRAVGMQISSTGWWITESRDPSLGSIARSGDRS